MEKETKPEETELEIISDFEIVSNSELIASAYNGIMAMDAYDPMTATGQAKKKRIQRRCINIIDKCIEELHDYVTEDEDKDDE